MHNLVPHQPYHQLLIQAFEERRERNSQYSLRAFARDVDISPTTLCKVLRYERNLSKRNLAKLTNFLELSPLEVEKLSFERLHSYRNSRSVDEKLLEEDTFHLISDWYYFAILSLSKTEKCRSDVPWIAERLGISRIQAMGAVRRLERLALIRREKGRLIRTSASIRTSNDVPSSALRKLHKQQMQLGIESLHRIPVQLRDITSVTMAIDPTRIPLAKRKISEFRGLLSDFLEEGQKKEVYLLTVQLIPLSQKEKKR